MQSFQAIRIRWAAIGAAVAITLGAGGMGVTQALTSSGPRAIYNAIQPCRLTDLRPAPDTIGPRPAPLGAGETLTLAGWGAIGECNLPAGTTALALDVTAVGATEPRFLKLFPAGGDTSGTSSNLNPGPGQRPEPNSVNVTLDGAGNFSIFNRAGSVSVIIDVMGVFDDHDHDDRYYTKAQVDQIVIDTVATAVTVGNGEGVGSSVCTVAGIEMYVRNARGVPVDHRFSFIVPDFAYGQIRADGSIRNAAGIGTFASVEHPGPGLGGSFLGALPSFCISPSVRSVGSVAVPDLV